MFVITRAFATFGGSGFFPIAPATFASFIFCLIYAFIPGGHWVAHPFVLLGTLILSIPASTAMEERYGDDPGCVVIDEVVGMQVVLVLACDVSLIGLLVAFLLFRVFDIAKPFPVGRSQHLPGGWGIVMDDFLAGIYTRAALIGIGMMWPRIGSFGW